MQNESVVGGQRERVGGQLVQRRIFQTQRRLNIAAGLLLMKDVGDVVGAECAGGMGFADCGSNGVWTVFADKNKQFTNLPAQGTIRIGEAS